MEYWRQRDATPDDLETQRIIGLYVREVGLEIARDCGELREDEPEWEFYRRAREANIRLIRHMEQTGGVSLRDLLGRSRPQARPGGGVLDVLPRFLGGRPWR